MLHFDFYGRLTAIEVTGAVGSVLPPALIEQAESDRLTGAVTRLERP